MGKHSANAIWGGLFSGLKTSSGLISAIFAVKLLGSEDYGEIATLLAIFVLYLGLNNSIFSILVGKIYALTPLEKDNNKLFSASLLLTVSSICILGTLTAICTYMNMHGKACRIFKNEKEHTLLINILNTETKYFISYDLEKGWTVKNTNKEVHASANLIFKNEDTARKAALGQLDFWIASASGDIVLAGLIPMLDKFGYVARIAQREVPLPI